MTTRGDHPANIGNPPAPPILPYGKSQRRFLHSKWSKRFLLLSLILTSYIGFYGFCWSRRVPAANLAFCCYTGSETLEPLAFLGFFPVYWAHRNFHELAFGEYSFTRHNWDRRRYTWGDKWYLIKECWGWNNREDADPEDPQSNEPTPATSSAPLR